MSQEWMMCVEAGVPYRPYGEDGERAPYHWDVKDESAVEAEAVEYDFQPLGGDRGETIYGVSGKVGEYVVGKTYLVMYHEETAPSPPRTKRVLDSVLARADK